MKRTKLSDRQLPCYTHGEEIMNMVTHIVGGGLSIIAATACILKAAHTKSAVTVVAGSIYGLSLIAVYAMSSIYHGLKPCTGKKVMQVIDHCMIYFLIAGSYTPLVLGPIRQIYPAIGWGLFAAQWTCGITAATLTAIDLKKYRVFSMICYISMGWGIVLFLPQAIEALGSAGFYLLLAGGIAYTVGAICFAIGSKKRWMHAVFHIFVVLGSALQFFAIYLYAI